MRRKLAASFVAASFVLIWAVPAFVATFDELTIPVGNEPGSIAVADLNHDGKPDIVVANTAGGSMSILLGDGKGHFQPAPGSPFPVGPNPNDIAVGDFNGDGDLDLLVPNTQTPNLTILLGDGTGRFHPAPHSPFATASQPHPHGAAVADFDGDGKLDAMIDSWGRSQVNLLLGDGRGNLITPGRFFDVGRHPYQRLRSADFNKDGKPDVVTTNLGGSSVTILLGDGTGGFHEPAGSPFAAGASLGGRNRRHQQGWQSRSGDHPLRTVLERSQAIRCFDPARQRQRRLCSGAWIAAAARGVRRAEPSGHR